MRHALPLLLSCAMVLSACSSDDPSPGPPTLVVEPDDGRGPLLDAIAGAKGSIRLTIYALSDLASVSQSPPAPAASIVQALIDRARAGLSVRVIVDRLQYETSGNATQIQATVAALRAAGASVHASSTAFCYTHQKTFLIDGPSASEPRAPGTAIIMSLNLQPGYFLGTRDYAVITRDPGIVQEVARVFESDFELPSPLPACWAAHGPATTGTPPTAADTPALAESQLAWSPVNSKPRFLELIASATRTLELTTEELTDATMIAAVQAAAQSPARPTVRLLLSGDTGSNAVAVKTLVDLCLPNLAVRLMPGLPAPAGQPAYQTPLYMHGKQIIADGARAYLGSENLTNTSMLQNRELGYLFTDPAMIQRLQATFDGDFTTPASSLAVACPGGSGCTGCP